MRVRLFRVLAVAAIIELFTRTDEQARSRSSREQAGGAGRRPFVWQRRVGPPPVVRHWDRQPQKRRRPAAAPAVVTATGTLVTTGSEPQAIDAHHGGRAGRGARGQPRHLSGRAVLDVPKKRLKLMALTGSVDRREVLSPERRRNSVTDETLKLSSMDARGEVTAISTWRRRK